jgi:hypothetical protein
MAILDYIIYCVFFIVLWLDMLNQAYDNLKLKFNPCGWLNIQGLFINFKRYY